MIVVNRAMPPGMIQIMVIARPAAVAEFSVGDFELYYRMHHRAGRAIRAVLEADVDDAVRNEAAYRLARIHFQKDQSQAALRALDGIRGPVPEAIRGDVAFLRANLYLATGRPSEAVDVLRRLQGPGSLKGFSAYNLGIALLQDGRQDAALAQLERSGRLGASDAAGLAIRDKSNLLLGTLRFESQEFDAAQRSLDRVRLAGPFSNQALLRAGWADASAENFERALVPWNLLAERESTDIAVQEAWLALPYAYSKLDVHGRAALLYGQAVESLDGELGKVDASIANIRDGEFLKALVREEIRLDANWVIRLRSLPNAPETFYLIALMASHDFQTALHPRSARAAQSACEFADVDRGEFAARVHRVDVRREDDVGPCFLAQAEVGLEVPAVVAEVVPGTKLGGVDENGDGRDVAASPRRPNERQMALM